MFFAWLILVIIVMAVLWIPLQIMAKFTGGSIFLLAIGVVSIVMLFSLPSSAQGVILIVLLIFALFVLMKKNMNDDENNRLY